MAKKAKPRKGKLLVGWETIAAYMRCSVATAKRREEEGLPVARVGGAVCALSDELDGWVAARTAPAKRRPRR